MPEPTVLLLSTSDTDLITARASGARLSVGESVAAGRRRARRAAGRRRHRRRPHPRRVSGLAGRHRHRRRQRGADRRGQRRAVARRRADGPLHRPRGRRGAGPRLSGPGRRGEPPPTARLPVRHAADDRLRLRAAGRPRRAGESSTGRRATDDDGPTIAVLYYRAQHLAGNTGYVEALCRAIEDAGGAPLPVFCASLRTAEPDCSTLLETADAMVTTVLAAGGATPAAVVGRAATTTPGTSHIWPRWTSRSCRACA